MQRASACDPVCAPTPPSLVWSPQLEDKYDISDSWYIVFLIFPRWRDSYFSFCLSTYISIYLSYLPDEIVFENNSIRLFYCKYVNFYSYFFYVYRNEYGLSYLSIYVSSLWIYLSFYLIFFNDPHLCPSTHLYTYLPIHLPIYLSLFLWLSSLSFCLFDFSYAIHETLQIYR